VGHRSVEHENNRLVGLAVIEGVKAHPAALDVNVFGHIHSFLFHSGIILPWRRKRSAGDETIFTG
jgi:hypothetical protein